MLLYLVVLGTDADRMIDENCIFKWAAKKLSLSDNDGGAITAHHVFYSPYRAKECVVQTKRLELELSSYDVIHLGLPTWIQRYQIVLQCTSHFFHPLCW